jgi:hypothetical protein
MSTSNPRTNGTTVAGEDRSMLCEAFRRFRTRVRPDGLLDVKFNLPPDLGDPFVRALLRTEAELMLEDADLIGIKPYGDQRTQAQRRADAVVLLLTRVAEALDTPG